MRPPIELGVIWLEPGLAKLEFRIASDSYSARVELYADPAALRGAAQNIRGFPTDCADRRDFELGTFDDACAGGGVRLHFATVDGAGHSGAMAIVRSDITSVPMLRRETATFFVPAEAAAIDLLVERLDAVATEVEETAY